MSTILVTGASTGIGQEAALHMARKGHDVYASARNPDSAQDLKDKIAAENLPVKIVRLDVVDPATIESAIAQIMAESGRIDVLVNNAGIGAGQAVEETPLEVAREIFETNYFGQVSVLKAVTPIMREQNSGRIINVGSLAGAMVFGCHAHYSASKWAMEGLCEALALEMAPFNVRVSIIQPGSTLTPIWGKGAMPEPGSPYDSSMARLGRFFEYTLQEPAMPSDVAEVIAEAIESENPRFRYPVGKDAVETVAARERIGAEAWIEMNRLQGDEFAAKWAEVVGRDYFG